MPSRDRRRRLLLGSSIEGGVRFGRSQSRVRPLNGPACFTCGFDGRESGRPSRLSNGPCFARGRRSVSSRMTAALHHPHRPTRRPRHRSLSGDGGREAVIPRVDAFTSVNRILRRRPPRAGPPSADRRQRATTQCRPQTPSPPCPRVRQSTGHGLRPIAFASGGSGRRRPEGSSSPPAERCLNGRQRGCCSSG